MRRLTRTSGAALAFSLALATSACGDDGTPAEPDETATEDTSAEPEPGQEPEAVQFVDFGEEPAVRPRYKRAALRAVDDELITMVPSILPDGWTAVGGGYRADPQWWRMEFTTPAGEVALDQLPGTAEKALARATTLEAQDDVDLSDWGTGSWSAWQHGGLSVLAYDLKGSTVILQGAAPDEVRALAESLLPAEDARSSED